MPNRLRRRRLIVLGAAFALLAIVGWGCTSLESGPTPGPTATPLVLYVTPTPEGYQAPTQPTPTPNVVYVTATPGGLEGQGLGEGTPYVIYVTATPLRVGPFGGTQAGLAGTQAPTLDLSGVTLVPTGRPTEAGATVTPTPTARAATPTPTETPAPTATPLIPEPREGAVYSDLLGINFISSAQHEADGQRFNMGVDAGAGWDRFAIYWSDIEVEPNNYHWEDYDEVVRNDVIHGLRTNAILLGTPDIYMGDSTVPSSIHEPVFADGTDKPGRNKDINPNNPWAEFVDRTVRRYMPGGKLADRENWPDGAGIRVWEIWNEPDFQQFWQGSAEDYARLLKVAYIAARHADPDSRVMIGGLVMFEQPSFIGDVLNTFKNDPDPVDQRYPFDIVAVHSYSHPAYSFIVLQRLDTLLATHGLTDKEIWLNESGVAVWDDYPGPEWATSSDQVLWRASMSEQADYVIQNATFALLGGASKLFHFQLYDDCGNQPRGTTFAPHDGSLCSEQAVCWGDALGLVRNREDNVCFNQHPEAGTTRPAYEAFQLLAQVFGTQKVVPLSGYQAADRQWMIFARPDTSEIITVVWDESGQAGNLAVPARAAQATLIQRDGESQTITPNAEGVYDITLQAATNRSQAEVGGYQFMIGGPPVILIEQTTEPIVTVLPLLDVSNTAALVRWRSSDPSIQRYEVYYRDDTSGEDEWVRWIETDSPGEELFAAGIGRSYSFFARGQRADGQWTQPEPYAQAWTKLE